MGVSPYDPTHGIITYRGRDPNRYPQPDFEEMEIVEAPKEELLQLRKSEVSHAP